MERTLPSIAEQLSRAHAALLYDLGKLEESVRKPTATNEESARQHLRRIQKELIEHFRCEEENGYMEAIRKRDPNKEKAIAELEAEHRQLAGDLELLIRTTSEGLSHCPAFGENVSAWIKSVRRHEAKENAFVQESFNLDVNAED